MPPLDLTALNVWLATLGPWGIVAAAALGFFGPKLLARIKLPTAPTPTPAVPTAPAKPLRDLLLDSLMQILRVRYPEKEPTAALYEILAREVSTHAYYIAKPPEVKVA